MQRACQGERVFFPPRERQSDRSRVVSNETACDRVVEAISFERKLHRSPRDGRSNRESIILLYNKRIYDIIFII